MADDIDGTGSKRRGLGLLPRLGGAGPVWVLNALSIALGVTLHATLSHRLGVLDPRFHIPWYVLAVGFGLAEMHVVHLRFRSGAHSFSLHEVALILGRSVYSSVG